MRAGDATQRKEILSLKNHALISTFARDAATTEERQHPDTALV